MLRVVLGFALLLASPALGFGSPRYYIVVSKIEPPQGMSQQDPTLALTKEIFQEELKKHPQVEATPIPGNEIAVAEELKKRKLKGYNLNVKLLSVTRNLQPPPQGKRFRVLSKGVKLTVIGTTLPNDMLAVGGEGESLVQMEVGQQISENQERELQKDSLRDAIAQAILQAIRKLDAGGMTPKPEKRRAR